MNLKEKNFYQKVEIIDSLISEKKLERIPDLLPRLFKDSETLKNYFYIELEDSDWLEPLLKNEIIGVPTEREIIKAKNESRYLIWPEYNYLKKIAAEKPEDISNLISQLDTIDDSSIHNKALDIAEGLPANALIPFIQKEIKWITSKDKINIRQHEKYFHIARKLINNGYSDYGLQLTYEILNFKANKRKRFSGVDITPKIDSWYYQKMTDKYLPEFINKLGKEALEKFFDLLERYIILKEYGDKPNDGSYFWRPAIENHKQNEPLNFIDHLVRSIRDSIQNLANNDEASIDVLEIVESLEKREWYIFIRMTLNLLSSIDNPDNEELNVIKNRLLDYKLFDSFWSSHEYSILIKRHFKNIDSKSQNVILEWIEDGPKRQKIDNNFEEDELSPKKISAFKDSWKRDKLAWIADDLDHDWSVKYEDLKESLGEPSPSFPVYTSGGIVGEVSPLSSDDLKDKTVSQIIDYLNKFEEAKDSFRGPTKEGLANTLSTVISDDPDKFVDQIHLFKNVEPQFLRALFQGLRGATTNNEFIDWENILNVLEWVVNEFQEVEKKNIAKDAKTNWKWVIDSILNLLREEFKVKHNLKFNHKEKIWNLLSELSDIKYPTFEEEKERLSSSMDPSTLSLNTTRGKALHAVIRYISWYKEKSKQKDISLKKMSDVKKVLEKHLDINNDPLLSVRAIYGQWLPFLIDIDKKWVQSHSDIIFPEDKNLKKYFDAAWSSYITYNRPYGNVLPVLKGKYKYAISFTSDEAIDHKLGKSPRTSLAQHLMVYYWWGDLNLDSELLEYFWRNADEATKVEAINFIGRSLRQAKGRNSFDSKVITRLKRLWEYRWEFYEEQPGKYKNEISSFGSWIISNAFEAEWILNNFDKVNNLNISLSDQALIKDYLTDVVDDHPVKTFKCLEGFIRNTENIYEVNYWKDDIMNILQVVRQKSSEEIDSRIREFVNYLGSLNYQLLNAFRPINREL